MSVQVIVLHYYLCACSVAPWSSVVLWVELIPPPSLLAPAQPSAWILQTLLPNLWTGNKQSWRVHLCNHERKWSEQRQCTYFLTHDWLWLCYLGNEINCFSVGHHWLLNTEQRARCISIHTYIHHSKKPLCYSPVLKTCKTVSIIQIDSFNMTVSPHVCYTFIFRCAENVYLSKPSDHFFSTITILSHITYMRPYYTTYLCFLIYLTYFLTFMGYKLLNGRLIVNHVEGSDYVLD